MGVAKITVTAFQCERCGHKWLPKEIDEGSTMEPKHLPKVCPKCKSPYWDTPRKQKVIKSTT